MFKSVKSEFEFKFWHRVPIKGQISPSSAFCDLSLCGRFLRVCSQGEYSKGVRAAEWSRGGN